MSAAEFQISPPTKDFEKWWEDLCGRRRKPATDGGLLGENSLERENFKSRRKKKFKILRK